MNIRPSILKDALKSPPASVIADACLVVDVLGEEVRCVNFSPIWSSTPSYTKQKLLDRKILCDGTKGVPRNISNNRRSGTTGQHFSTLRLVSPCRWPSWWRVRQNIPRIVERRKGSLCTVRRCNGVSKDQTKQQHFNCFPETIFLPCSLN